MKLQFYETCSILSDVATKNFNISKYNMGFNICIVLIVLQKILKMIFKK